MLSEISQTEKDKFCIISLMLLLLPSRFRMAGSQWWAFLALLCLGMLCGFELFAESL